MPSFGVKIECPDGGCNGLPCEISPNSDGSVDSKESAVGAGNAAFCVVTVPKGGVANIVAYNVDGSSGGSDSDSDSDSGSSSSAAPSSTAHGLKAGGFAALAEKPTSTTAAPSSTEVSTTAAASTTEVASTTAAAESTTTAAESTAAETTDASATATTKAAHSTTGGKASSTARARPSVNPGMFHENGTSPHQTTAAPSGPSATQADSAPVTTTTKKGEAGRQQGSTAFAGLIVAFVAAACFL